MKIFLWKFSPLLIILFPLISTTDGDYHEGDDESDLFSGSGIDDSDEDYNGEMNAVKIIIDATLSDWTSEVEQNFKSAVASAVNSYCSDSNGCEGDRQRWIRSSFSVMPEDVIILDDYPQMVDEGLAVAFYVNSDGTILSGNDLYRAVYESQSDIEMAIGLNILSLELLQSKSKFSLWSILMIRIVIIVCGVFVLTLLICAILFCSVILWKKKTKNRVVKIRPTRL